MLRILFYKTFQCALPPTVVSFVKKCATKFFQAKNLLSLAMQNCYFATLNLILKQVRLKYFQNSGFNYSIELI